MRVAHDDGVTVDVGSGVVVAVDVGLVGVVVAEDVELVTVVVGALGAAAVVVLALSVVVVTGAAPLVRESVAVPVEHAATSDVRIRTAGSAARDGIRLRTARA